MEKPFELGRYCQELTQGGGNQVSAAAAAAEAKAHMSGAVDDEYDLVFLVVAVATFLPVTEERGMDKLRPSCA